MQNIELGAMNYNSLLFSFYSQNGLLQTNKCAYKTTRKTNQTHYKHRN